MNCVEGLKIKDEKDKRHICKSCIIGKAYRQSFLYKHNHANNILNVIVVELSYFDVPTFGGTK